MSAELEKLRQDVQSQEPNTQVPAGDNPIDPAAPVATEEPGLRVRHTNWWLIGGLSVLVIGIALYVRAKMNQSSSSSGTSTQPQQVTYNITVNNGSEFQPTQPGQPQPGQIGTPPPPGGTPPVVSSNPTPTIPVKTTQPITVGPPPVELPPRQVQTSTPVAASVPHPAVKAPALPPGAANAIAMESARQGVPNPLMNPTANTTATLATKPTVLEKQAAQIQTSTKVPIGERTALASQLRRTMVTPMRPAKKATPAKVSPHVVKLPTKPTTTEKQAAKVTSSSSMPLGARTALANRLRF